MQPDNETPPTNPHRHDPLDADCPACEWEYDMILPAQEPSNVRRFVGNVVVPCTSAPEAAT
jgi:hypothetical protein